MLQVFSLLQSMRGTSGRLRSPATGEQFLTLLKGLHGEMAQARPDYSPGAFKSLVNVAGNTRFVDPDRVAGTLPEGFASLPREGFARALALHVLVTDVHPFADGNGRVARLMLSRELQIQGLVPVVIPTLLRNEYLGALRSYSRQERPDVIVRCLEFAQRITAACLAPNYADTLRNWASTGAFMESEVHARLRMPRRDVRIVWEGGQPCPDDYLSGHGRTGGQR